jgi:hypothetical protein
MKCGKCNFSEIVPGTGMLKCQLTEEVRLGVDECNCDDIRSLRVREIEVAENKEAIKTNLNTLRDKLVASSTRVDIKKILNILNDTTKEADVRIAEVIEYLNTFN